MSEPASRGIPWRRVVAEGVAIVVSILLAFAIQAGWDGRVERGREQALLTTLERDMEQNDSLIRYTLERHRASSELAELFLGFTIPETRALPEDSVSAFAFLGNVSTLIPLDGALQTADLSVLSSSPLRYALGTWSGLAAEHAEMRPMLTSRFEALISLNFRTRAEANGGTIDGSSASVLASLRENPDFIAGLQVLQVVREIDERKLRALLEQTDTVLELIRRQMR